MVNGKVDSKRDKKLGRRTFIKHLNQNKLEINIAWEYYQNKNGKADFNLFQQMVSMNTQEVIDTLCIHFEVVKVVNKEGKTIKYC